ncbi:MAG: hypothetical protein ABIP20_14470 [Chthoniobacteraceae bacterium]
MIAFRDALPLIVLRNRRVMAFDREWLARVLAVAAGRAGHPEWPLAPHVAESVHAWLGSLDDRTTMPVDSFTRAVREALKAIGFAEIGACFEAAAPFARISLMEIAQHAGNGFELAFFAALELRLREVFTAGGSYCELHGMEPCVKALRRRRHWSSRCDDLRAEIVAFARNQSVQALMECGAGRERDIFLHVA